MARNNLLIPMQNCQVKSFFFFFFFLISHTQVHEQSYIILARLRTASIPSGIFHTRRLQGIHATLGLLSFHFDHIAQTWEWVTYHTENHDLCICTKKGMISLGEGKKTREGQKKKKRTQTQACLCCLKYSQLLLFRRELKKLLLWLGLFSVCAWTPRDACQQPCGPCSRHILVKIKQGKALWVHPSRKGTTCTFYLGIYSMFTLGQSCPSTVSSKKIALWGNKMVAWKSACSQSHRSAKHGDPKANKSSRLLKMVNRTEFLSLFFLMFSLLLKKNKKT